MFIRETTTACVCMLLGVVFGGEPAAFAQDHTIAPDRLAFTEEQLTKHVSGLTEAYFRDFRHPDTGVLYGARLRTRQRWTSPADVKAEKPHPWGYGSRIADTSLHSGHMLVALLDAYEAHPDPLLRDNIRQALAALKLIGSLPDTRPKPGKSAQQGLVPRGPHPDDLSAWYDDSSMDQHTTYIISLARYANSTLASDEERAWIRQSLERVGRRLEKNGWSIKRADGVTQAHVGFAWTGYNSQHASILLPAVLALYKGTANEHWLQAYEDFSAQKDSLRWDQLTPGPHVSLNAHPIYANQGSFRLNALYHFETRPQRKAVLHELLSYVTELQMERDFPGPMYRRFHTEDEWRQLRNKWKWTDTELHGCQDAWQRYEPSMLDGDALAVLAHVRFPLSAFHMILLSDNSQLIQQHLPAIWKMLTTVDLQKVDAGETNYLLSVVALHVYAYYYRQQRTLDSDTSSNSTASKPQSVGSEKPSFPIVADAGIGPTIDVTVDGNRAYAIGRGVMSVLDISDPRKPHVLSRLSGLGNTRQIAVRNGIACIGSREDGLFLVNVSKADEPELLCHFDSVEFATGVSISGNVLFIACRHFGVELVDISAPHEPRHLSTVRTGEAQSVAIRNGFLYAGVWAQSQVVVVDVRDPLRPRITARVPLDGFGDGVDVCGKQLYAATGHHSRAAHRQPGDPGFGRGHGLEIFDLSDPAKPVFLSRVKFSPFYGLGNDMWSVVVANGVAFVADTHNGMVAVDVSDVRAPRVIGQCVLPHVEGRDLRSYAGAVAPINDYVYVAGGWSDLHVVAAASVARLPEAESDTPPRIPEGERQAQVSERRRRVYRSRVYGNIGQVHAVDLVSDKAIVACGSEGVQVVQLWPTIKQLSKFPTSGFATDVSVLGSRVYIAASSGGLLVCELSPQNELRLIGQYQSTRGSVKQLECPPPGNYVVLQAGANAVEILDIREPSSPKVVLTDKRLGLLYGDQLQRGLLEERYTAAFWHVSGTYWYDLYGNAAAGPVWSGDHHPERFGASNGLVALGNKTLVTTRGGYVLVDRQERRPFKELALHRLGQAHQHLGKPVIFGQRLYVANRSTGLLTVADISEPTDPVLIEQSNTDGHPGRIAVHDGNLLIPNGYDGLLILEH